MKQQKAKPAYKATKAQPTKPAGFDVSEFLSTMQDRVNHCIETWDKNHQLAQDDLRILSGDQWPEDVRAERINAKRPTLTINKLPQFVRQVTGDHRKNRISIRVSPVQASMSNAKIKNAAGTTDYTLAQVMQGLVRDVEYTSRADSAYDRALDLSAQTGLGFLRVLKRPLSNVPGSGGLQIRATRNPFSVMYDPAVMFDDEPDYSGAMYCFVSELMHRRTFEKQYPDATTAPLESSAAQEEATWWVDEQNVRVSEYWTVELYDTEFAELSDGSIFECTDDYKALKDELAEMGVSEVMREKGKGRRVWFTRVTSGTILEGPTLWPGSIIPVVPVLGAEIFDPDGYGTVYESVHRHAHDAQRMFNYWQSAATESVALAPKAAWLAEAKTILQHKDQWSNQNVQSRNVLTYDHLEGRPPPQRINPPPTPAAELQMALASTDNIKATMGMYDASLGARSNETSGRAIQARQQEADTATYLWHDNLAKAVGTIGLILVELLPKMMTSERAVRIRLPDDTEDYVKLNTTMVDRQTGRHIRLHDIGMARYSVQAHAGPSLESQRQEAAESMMEFIRVVPDAGRVIGDLVARNQNWAGAEVIADRLRKIVPPQLLSPREMQDMQGQMPPPQAPDPLEEKARAAQGMALEAETADNAARIAEAQRRIQGQPAEGGGANGDLKTEVRTIVAEALAEFFQQAQGGP